jgi:hypothetical protein
LTGTARGRESATFLPVRRLSGSPASLLICRNELDEAAIGVAAARPEALTRALQARVLGAQRSPKTKRASREATNPAKPFRLSVELSGIEPLAS